MLRISRLTDYATVVMTCLAKTDEEVLSASQIAQCTHIETPTVSKVLKQLSQAGLVQSFRGTRGGYQLARSANDISLAAIVEALEGPIGMTECTRMNGQCDFIAHCSARHSWLQINQVISQALETMSLAQMVAPKTTSISSLAKF